MCSVTVASDADQHHGAIARLASAGADASFSVTVAMLFGHRPVARAAMVFAVSLTTSAAFAQAAAAATPISVEAAAQFPLARTGRDAGGTVQSAFGLDYDFGPQTIVPVRASLHLDDANGSRGNGRINAFGAGLAARLTTPIYAGAGLSLVTVNVGPDLANAATTNATGIGTNLFVGERLLSLPGGTSVALQATYEKLPHVAGIDPSAFSLGLRVQL